MTRFVDVFAVSISLTIACLVCYYIGEALVGIVRACAASARSWGKPVEHRTVRPRLAIRRTR